MEKKIKEGVYLSFVTRERWLQRTKELTGEDLRKFVSECNPIAIAPSALLKITLGMDKKQLISLGKEMEPDFNPHTDYYVIRYATP